MSSFDKFGVALQRGVTLSLVMWLCGAFVVGIAATVTLLLGGDIGGAVWRDAAMRGVSTTVVIGFVFGMVVEYVHGE